MRRESNRESSPAIVSFVVENDGRRLDKVVRDRVPDLSRTQAQRLIKNDEVTVDGCVCKPAYRVQQGQQVTVSLPPEKPKLTLQPQHIPLDIIHEDEHLLVVNKPAGLVVHPAPGHPDGTLVNALLAHCPQIAGVGHRKRPGVVHRLDKETSGVLVIAKDDTTLKGLQEQFKRREVAKMYTALVEGQVQPPEGIIEVPVGRDDYERKKMAATRDGQYARTMYRVTRTYKSHTLLDVHPYTGRTHQIRVHLAWLGYPVVGDTTYGHRHQRLLQDRHFLHAARLRFTHPEIGEELTSEAPLPSALVAVLRQLDRGVVGW